MRTILDCCVVAAVMMAGVANVKADCDPVYTGGTIAIVSGTLTGQTVNPADPLVVLPVGALLDGTVSIHVVNNGDPGNIFPVCGTPSWGPHESSGWSIAGHQPPGEADYAVPISVTVPMGLGTYYLFFACGLEMACSNVLSCTNWANAGGDVWNDGYDVADWTHAQAQNAVSHGWTCCKWIVGGNLIDTAVPAGAVAIVVEPATAVQPSSWGAIKEMFK